MIYLTIFIATAIILWISEHMSGIVRVLFVVIGLLLPISLAAFRDVSVGIDTAGYVSKSFAYAQYHTSFREYGIMLDMDPQTVDLELGYRLLAYLSGMLSTNISLLLGITESIVMILVYFSAELISRITNKQSFSNHFSIALSILCYLLIHYNMSLSMARQSVSCAFVLLGIINSCDDNHKAGTVLVLIGTLFHATALFGLVAIGLVIYYKSRKKIPWTLFAIVLLISSMGFPAYRAFLQFLGRFISIPAKFSSQTYMIEGSDVNIAWLYLVIGFIIIFKLSISKDEDQNYTNDALLISLLSLSIFPMSVITATGGRLLYYTFYYSSISLPLFAMKESEFYYERKLDTFARSLAVLVFALIYWIATYGLNDYSGTINYVLAPIN